MINQQSYDAIIIGAGHNGLVCGAYLAKAGHKVLVLERRHIIGGASVTEELWPGYFVNTAAHMLGMLQPKVILDLELASFGYEVIPVPPGVHLIEGVGPVVLWKEVDKLCEEFARFSRKDAVAYPGYLAHLADVAPFFRQLMWEIPPDPSDLTLRGLARLAGFAWRNRKAISKFHAIADLMTMSAYDYLARWFESEQIKIILGYYPAGAAGQTVSIHSPGTAYFLLRNFLRDNATPAGGTGLALGGMGRISEAIARSGQRFGLEVRTDSPVAQVLIEQGRAAGVRLGNGTTLRSKVVVSNAATQHLMADLLPENTLPALQISEAEQIHGQATTFKIHLAVEAPIPFVGLKEAGYDDNHPVQVTLAPSIDYMEHAYYDMRQGKLSRRPYMTIQTPTLADASLAPPGKHLLSIYGGHVPSGPGQDDGVMLREELFRKVMDTISMYAPDFDQAWSHRQILLASDYERIFSLPGGSPHHGDMTLDQLFFRRPIKGMAGYTTLVPGLFLCGASTHPGGGVTGIPGHNAALVVEKALRNT